MDRQIGHAHIKITFWTILNNIMINHLCTIEHYETDKQNSLLKPFTPNIAF